MAPGEIYRHDSFYFDELTGEQRRKFFVVLALLPGGDVVARLLTSRSHGRPENPRCFHGHPFPSYFLGVPGKDLGSKTWVDLRYLEDFDGLDVQREVQRGRVTLSMTLEYQALPPLLDCVAGAEDTSRRQERAIRNLVARMR
jgi:hypothetical protein